MIQEILEDATHRMDQTVEHTRQELAKIRTGRANPELLNSIKVPYYGTETPLYQLANISVPEARLITIQPFDKSVIREMEKAILDSNLGLTPNNNGDVILLPIPPLSEERRKELIKIVHHQVEEGRIAIRNVRRDANQQLKNLLSEGHVSEDEIKRSEEEVQTITDEHIEHLNTLLELKEKEIMEF